MKKKNNDLSYLEHLEELRYRIIFCLIFFFIVLIIAFLNSKTIVAIFEKPITNLNLKLHFLKPYEKFVGYFNISLFISFLITLPILFIQIMLFIYPALIGKEKIIFWFFVILMPIFFVSSFIFSYWVLLPICYNFLLNFSKDDGIIPVISFLSHINMIITILLGTTLLFQFPFVLIILISLEIIKIDFLKKIRSYIIVFIFIIAAIVTPPDVISQIILAIPLYLLFEFTIIIGSIINKIKESVWKEENLSKKH
ncbi:MAG TPA: twin-arginine translocase subunit TatC [Spirochaetota bacterium]|mgnify:FL=1|nr:twin-arginine translocase subunit TatC [Spirochaetota bacterium]HOL57671.1 twin-arginine translocase subunit TatC [Spirochaetota bacterium]HPP05273.1 twin-arginine translocase subunit TatC [Spirochaetota bacterium]